MNKQDTRTPPFSPDEFAHLGGDEVAYIRETEAKDVIGQFPIARQMPPTSRLFVLHAADGTPIVLADSRAAALANAHENQLKTVSLH